MTQTNLGPYEQAVKDQITRILPQDNINQLLRLLLVRGGSGSHAHETSMNIFRTQHPHLWAYLKNLRSTVPMEHRATTECPVCRDPLPYTPPSYRDLRIAMDRWYEQNFVDDGFPLIHVGEALREEWMRMANYATPAISGVHKRSFESVGGVPVCLATKLEG